MEEKRNDNYHSEYQNLAFHPWNVMLTLLLIAITALFLALMAGLVYTRVQNELGAVKLPTLFLLTTLLLLSTSRTMWQAQQNYRNDDTSSYMRSLRLTAWLSVLFLVVQVFAWQELFAQNIGLASSTSASYLYVLSGLHFAHVIAGLPFLFLFIRAAKREMKEPITVLVYFSDPEKRLKLRLLTIYWHFLDGLWVFLVLFLLANYLIQ